MEVQHSVPSTVITMNHSTWTTKYRNRLEFMANFDTEQDYVDAMFIMIILFNYGIWLDKDALL